MVGSLRQEQTQPHKKGRKKRRDTRYCHSRDSRPAHLPHIASGKREIPRRFSAAIFPLFRNIHTIPRLCSSRRKGRFFTTLGEGPAFINFVLINLSHGRNDLTSTPIVLTVLGKHPEGAMPPEQHSTNLLSRPAEFEYPGGSFRGRRSLGGNRRSLKRRGQRTAAAAMSVCGGGPHRAAGASIEPESAAAGGSAAGCDSASGPEL